MRRYVPSTEVLAACKRHPIRVWIPTPSRCCHQPRIIVQSLEGGFITANCANCGKHDTLGNTEFAELGESLWVSCPECRAKMSAELVPDGSGYAKRNYGFVCAKCQLYLWLSDLVLRWEEL